MRHLCIELDMHYSDEELSDAAHDDAIRTMQEAMALLLVAGHEPPSIYQHICRRVAPGERSDVGSDQAGE
jgi:hypothetical protein